MLIKSQDGNEIYNWNNVIRIFITNCDDNIILLNISTVNGNNTLGTFNKLEDAKETLDSLTHYYWCNKGNTNIVFKIPDASK